MLIFTSASLQDVQEIGQKVGDVRTQNDSIIELLKKSNNPHKEESLSSEAQVW